MRNIQNALRSVCSAGLVLAWLLCANAAAADSIGYPAVQDSSTPDPNIVLPTGGLNGWFFNPGDPQLPFPAAPDPSQPWTSPENIATLYYWLTVVQEAGDDPALLQQLYGLGMISSPTGAAVSDALASQNIGNVPEPATLWLFGGGLAFVLILYTRTSGPGLTCKHGSL